MNVKSVSVTVPLFGGAKTAEDLMVYCARVSNPKNQENYDTGHKLLAYCLRNGHWSVFEMADWTVEIETSRAIAAQILRHRSFSFQEFCVAGDTQITLELPNGIRNGKRSAYKRSIKHLFDLQERGLKLPSNVRVFDEVLRTFTTAPIREVFRTGVKPLYRVTLENGLKIDTTKEHKFLTPDGFKSLEDVVGLVTVAGRATWSQPDAVLACNGVCAYTDRDWMSGAKQRSIASGRGVPGIADEAGVSYHTVRKWLKKHGLQFSKRETASYTPVWNRGKRYIGKPHSLETIQKMRASAKRGSASNLWRGGVSRSERLAISDWGNTVRAELLLKARHKCARCGSNRNLERHHLIPVSEDKSLAREKSNIEVLCFDCHRNHHRISGHAKSWREKSCGHTLTIHWSKVKSVEYLGEQMTYDMEVEHVSHNYVGNGIVTHNSQRYSEVQGFEPVELRTQDQKNRQASGNKVDDWTLNREVAETLDICLKSYDLLLSNGVSRETARMVLPLCTRTKLYMKGNVRSWIHYLKVRTGNGTQKEHQEIARMIGHLFEIQFPVIAQAMKEAQ